MYAPVKRSVLAVVAAGPLAVAVALGLAACSSPSPAGSPGRSTPAARPTTTGPATTSAPLATSSPTFVPLETPAGGEFLSPSGNIGCEVDYNRAGMTQVYCQTVTPARSVTMGVTGSYTTCTGVRCLGNAEVNAPTLAYGTATGVGPFRCVSASTGVTCTAGGRGFRISVAGIVPA